MAVAVGEGNRALLSCQDGHTKCTCFLSPNAEGDNGFLRQLPERKQGAQSR